MSSASYKVGGTEVEVNFDLIEIAAIHLAASSNGRSVGKVTLTDYHDILAGKLTAEIVQATIVENDARSRSRGSSRKLDSASKDRRSHSKSQTPVPVDKNKGKAKASTKLRSSLPRREKVPSTPTTCKWCHGSRLRVVNYGRRDKRMILECANTNCLATVGFTDLPEGTITGELPESAKNYGWYLRSVTDIYYPTPEVIAQQKAMAADLKPTEFIPETLYNREGEIMVRCPGQVELVKLM